MNRDSSNRYVYCLATSCTVKFLKLVILVVRKVTQTFVKNKKKAAKIFTEAN